MRIENIPFDYAYCYATAQQCTLSAQCLRHHAAQLNEEQTKPRERLITISPTYIERVAQGEKCGHFRSDVPLRYALGMKHLFDVVPKVHYSHVRKRVMGVFSSERLFFYAQKGEHLISPEQQSKIAHIFQQVGLEAPVFESYELHPDWSVS